MAMIRPVDLKDDGVWAMFEAAAAGELEEVRRLTARRPALVRCVYDYTEPVHFAVREGHFEVARFLVEQGAPLTHRSHPFGDSLLTVAEDREYGELSEYLRGLLVREFPVRGDIGRFVELARKGDLAGVETALRAEPALARSSTDTGDTALHAAAAGGHIDVIAALLDAGAAVDAVRSDGMRPVTCALRRRPVVDYLLERGAAYNIYLAAVLADSDYVRAALVRDRAMANFEDTSHQRPLSAAARRDDLEMVRLLLDHGADPSLPEEGAPVGGALWIAVYQGQREMARLLLEHGANPNTSPESSGSALGHARKDPEMAELLIRHGARDEVTELRKVETLISDGALEEVEAALTRDASCCRDPLAFWGEGILAGPANSANVEMIELLMRYGARVPPVSKWGPEYYFKHLQIGALLLAKGMDANHCNWQRFTLLHHFSAKGELEKVRLLLDHGADLNAVDEEYRSTALGCAARWGQEEVVALLLERGADVNLAGADWARPLRWARKKGRDAIRARLLAAGALG